MEAPTGPYRRIRPYQTRLLHIPVSDGAPDGPVVCGLYIADILHTTFGGLGLRSDLISEGDQEISKLEREDRIVEYEALSYTWGDQQPSKQIICNGVSLPVTENLFNALVELRRAQNKPRFLWADAICINQKDEREKSEQVRQMFVIFQTAVRVIAWVGPAHENIPDIVGVATSIRDWKKEQRDIFNESWFEEFLCVENPAAIDFWAVHAGLEYLYTRPWFERMWVQQEVFAAQELRIQCGQHQFSWEEYMSDPRCLIRRQPSKKRPMQQAFDFSLWPSDDDITESRTDIKVDDDKLDAVHRLEQLLKDRLTCFQAFYSTPAQRLADSGELATIGIAYNLGISQADHTRTAQRLDFIETLLYTAKLRTGDARDHVYGILGLTGFPAKAMPFDEWMVARQSGELFIPIDYTASLKQILCAVSWVALMKGGLALLAKFKVFRVDAGDDPDLPSWVIDWFAASQCFARRENDETEPIKLGNAFSVRNKSGRVRRLMFPPKAHEQFCADNISGGHPYTKLVVRGVVVEKNYFVQGRNPRSRSRRVMELWDLDIEVLPADLVVFLHAFTAGGLSNPPLPWDTFEPDLTEIFGTINGGLWLLRPVDEREEEFRLLACLSCILNEERSLYDGWGKDPKGQPWDATGHYRRFAVYGSYPSRLDVADRELHRYQTFTIV